MSGRCACVDGTLAILGACVSPSTGDAYCGPGERLGVDGCGFTPCDPGRTLDLATGRCGPTWVEGSSAETALDACGPDATRLLDTDHGRRLCGTGDAGCPRGARRIGGVCVRSVRCPAGSLYDGHACRPIVGSAPSTRQVDVGLWAAIAIGTDGGLGSSDLCRPLEQEAQVFGAAGSVGGPPIRLRIDLEFPDQDLTRSTAAVEVRDAVGELLHGDAARSAERAVTTMFELLRSLGGEATAASVEVEVRCNLGSSAALEDAGAARKIKQTPGDAGDTDGAPELPSP